MHSIGEDSTAVRYHVARSTEITGVSALWSPGSFDVTIFTEDGCEDHEVERVIGEILRFDPEWIYTTGPRGEYWHDVTDELAVGIGLQEKVGDGYPMTAWFTDIQNPGDWEITRSFGAALDHLFVIVGSDSYFARARDELRDIVTAVDDSEEAELGATDNPDDAQRI